MKRKEAKELGLKRYRGDRPCPAMHDSDRLTSSGSCIQCQTESSRRYKERNKNKLAESRKTYIAENREKIRKSALAWYHANRDRVSAERSKKRKANLPEFLERERDYCRKNRERIRESRREYNRIYRRERRKADPDYKCLTRMRDFIRRCTDSARGKKKYRTQEQLGYTARHFREHIESRWTEGMSWENYGEWHIDHIRSIKSFIDSGETDVRVINALSNLRPLWAFENLSKGA